MKLHTFFRINVIVVGIAAALLFPRVVSAQEIENTQWNDGPNVAAFQPATPSDTTNNLGSTTPQTLTMNPATSLSAESVVPDEATVTSWAPVRPWMIASFFLCIAAVVFVVIVDPKNKNRKLDARVGLA